MNEYPDGWNEDRVKRVIDHYENQNELEAVAEDEASFDLDDQTYIEVPKKLIPQVRELLVIANPSGAGK